MQGDLELITEFEITELLLAHHYKKQGGK